MFKQKYQWKKYPPVDSQAAAKLKQETGLSDLLIKILLERGYDSPEKIKQFIQPDETSLADPNLMHDMDKACQRIQEAIVNNEKIVIYGDYDVDGITSTAIMYETLAEQLGAANTSYYIPDRFKDGYGPNMDVYHRLVEDGTQLIITVDNGVTGNEEVKYAQEQGVDVVITDHHELPPELPEATAIVHPHYPESQYPFGYLSGAGVAFKVATALLGEVPQDMLDLAALGTVADIMPLVKENRALVKFGLQLLKMTVRPGLQALYKTAKIDPTSIDEQTIGFELAPRLNSLGRMANATAGVELLTTFDDQRAGEIATQVEKLNQTRKTLVAAETETALKKVDPAQDVNLIWQSGWNEGISGIVAGRLVEKTGKPTIIFSVDDDTGLAKGSGRSIEGFDLYQALLPFKDLMENFGGHSMACGLSIKEDRLDDLTAKVEKEAAKQNISALPAPKLEIAGTIDVADLNVDFIKEINQLAPFGERNPAPSFKFSGYQIDQAKAIGKNSDYLRLTLKAGRNKVNAISFSLDQSKVQEVVADPQLAEFVGSLSINRWRNTTSPQIIIQDLSYQGIQIIDQRTQHLVPELFAGSGAYIFFDDKILKQIKPYLGDAAQAFVASELIADQAELKNKELVLVDAPESIEELKALLELTDPERLRVIFYPKKEVYLNGMPGRQDFAALYRFAAGQTGFDLRKGLPALAKRLNLKREQLIFMLQVFFEVGFVRIERGVLSGRKVSGHFDLKKTVAYQKRQQMMAAQKKLIYSSFSALREFLQQELN